MGNIGFPELLVILVVAFLCIGPRRLPELARALGEAVRAFRQALESGEEKGDVSSLQDDVHEMKRPLFHAEDAPQSPVEQPEHATTDTPRV